MTFEEFIQYFPEGRMTPRGEYEAHCPGHEDKRSSLGIRVGDNGGIVMKCQAGCDNADILAAVHLKLRDLAPPSSNGKGPRYIAEYRYDAEDGREIATKFKTPDKDYRWRQANGDWNLKGVTIPLFGLPELLRTKPGDLIAIAEGEKDALSLRARGQIATTNPDGASLGKSKWKQEYTDWLASRLPGRKFIIFADNDEAGHEHADAVLHSLRRAGISVRLAQMAGLGRSEDVSDWLGRHDDGELQELLAEPSPVTLHWEPPLSLGETSPPRFPIEVLPCWLRRMAEAVAICLSIPVGAAAMFALSCLATTCQKRVQARIREGWIEPLSLWMLIVMEPANRKSPLFRQLLAPVVSYQAELRELMKPEIAATAASRRILEGKLKKAEQDAIKAKNAFAEQEAETRAREIASRLDALRVPSEPRLIVNDATPEKLGILLNDNAGRIAVMSPEGDVFQMMAGHYSSGQSNLGLYLAGHSGDDWTVDRVGRASVDLVNTAITFGLTIQPQILAGFAANPQFRGRGLLGRFLYCVPETLLGTRPAITPGVLQVVEQEYAARITALLSMPAAVGADGKPEAHLLEFDEGASEAMACVQDWIEPQLARWGELRPMADWAGKLAGAIARIVALLHLAELAEIERPWAIPVGAESVNALLPLREYLIAHAQIAFQAMGADETTEGARHILEWLKAHPVGRFSRRNIHRRLIRTFPSVAELDPALAVLLERGYIRQIAAQPDGKTGPKPVMFEVHPDFAGDGADLEGG